MSKLGTCFASPEEVIIARDEDPEEMYFIMQGDCTVNVLDERRVEHVALRLLVEG